MPEWTSAVLTLNSSGRIWYLHVEPGVYRWSSKSIVSLLRIVSACSRHQVLFTLKVSVPCTCVLLDRALTVLRPVASFSHSESENQKAAGEVGRVSHVYELKSVNRLGLDDF